MITDAFTWMGAQGGTNMVQLGALDTLFINLEKPGMPMHVSSFSVYNPETCKGKHGVTPRKIKMAYKAAIEKNLPVLKCKLQSVPMNIDRPYWSIDENFDIDEHIQRIALPSPGDWNTLCRVLSGIHSEQLSRDKPLWEAYIIENLDRVEGFKPGCFGIMFKVHHALMDGRTGVKLFSNLHTLAPGAATLSDSFSEADPDDEEIDNDIAAYKPAGYSEIFRRSGSNNFKLNEILRLGLKIPGSVRGIRKKVESNQISSISEKEVTRFNSTPSDKRVIDRVRLPIKNLRKAKSAIPGATLNDVAMTVVSGAMRKYLLAESELPDASLVATVPVDIRDKYDKARIGNKLTIMNVSLGSDIADPLARLEAMQQESQNAKAYTSAVGEELLNDVLECVSPGLLAWGMPSLAHGSLMGHLPVTSNTVITNVPGANCPLYLAGAELVESFGMGPLLPTTNLFHTVTSTCDWMSIGFVSCPESIKDPALYKQYLHESYLSLMLRVDTKLRGDDEEVYWDEAA